MSYRRKARSGFAGYTPRSGYLSNRDPYAVYRKHSPPETEYDRKLKSSVLQSELTGPSRFISREPSYKEKLPAQYEETKSELSEVDNFVEDLIKKQVDAFMQVTVNKEIPQEQYQEMVEGAIDSGHRFLEMKNHPDQVETFSREFGDVLEKTDFDETQRRKNVEPTSDSEVSG